ncbi:glycoprotein-N-acetylgalactosamine 3-beta-galactosyltransferase 1-like [Oppia nitens]|uniref:glycoprotein-N-acetylgalactosamine 3-beta-galactosyltransferase 1-like n=1 Tax=Oppia nitens TaxID=1686743 RepID=UPI0023DB9740|nr:glycoprotein-N-acetylgalactosamine 3-beta-galactosyltransferase 1-like [Oppia nitens]
MTLLSRGMIKLIPLLCSVVSGMIIAIIWRNYEQTIVEVQSYQNHIYGRLKDTNYNDWLKQKSIKRQILSEEFVKFELLDKNQRNVMLESEYLFKKVRVLCLVLSKSRKGSQAVRLTWANHCNDVIFFGSFSDHKIPVMKYPPTSSHSSFCYSFITTWHQFCGQFDWLLIAYDDTYAVIENLRQYVAPLNSSHVYYLGRAVKHYFTGVYNSADAGIVLSKGAAQVIKNVFSNYSVCNLTYIKGIPSVSSNFQVSLAIILSHFGANPVDTRDSRNRGRFHSFPPEKQLIPGMISIFNPYWRSSLFLEPEGTQCCSDVSITFNGIQPAIMYLTEYLLYHMSIFTHSPLGLGNKPPPYSSYKVDSDLDKKSLDKLYNSIEMGTPLIHVINKHNTIDKSEKFKSISNFLNDFFKS